VTIVQIAHSGLISGERFLQWWIGELAGCLPSAWRLRLPWSQAKQVLVPDANGWVLGRDRSDGSFEIFDRFQARNGAASGRFHRGEAVTLRLPAELALHKSMRLPLAAAENLREAVAFQLDRYTPYSYEDAYFDCALRQRDDVAGQLVIDATIVGRTDVDAARHRAEQLGCRIEAIEIKREAQPANGTGAEAKGAISLPVPALRHKPLAQLALTATASGLLVALTVVAIFLPLMTTRLRAEDATRQLDDARRQAEAAGRLQRENQELRRQAAFLADHAATHPAALDVLLELTKITPDDTWIDTAQLSGTTIQLSGLSASASALIGRYGQSSVFQNMEFRSPVTPDQRSNRERFQISGQLQTAAHKPATTTP
jgi:general secretion pathway protein L